MVVPSGEQFEIAHGDQRATVVEVGGGVREYRVGDRDVLECYPREAICAGGNGAVLIPWPTRLAAGRSPSAGSEPVAGGAFDVHSPRRLGDLAVDAAFTDLQRDGDGRAWARLGCPDGREVQLWCDDRYSVVQLYSGDTLAPDRRRRALAAEPM